MIEYEHKSALARAVQRRDVMGGTPVRGRFEFGGADLTSTADVPNLGGGVQPNCRAGGELSRYGQHIAAQFGGLARIAQTLRWLELSSRRD